MSENEALAPKDYEHWPTKSQERFNELQNPKCKKTANEIWIDERSPEELTRTLGVIKVIEFYNEEEVERNKWVRKHLDEAMTQRAVFIPFYDYKDYGPQKLLIHQAKSNIIGEGLFFLFTDLDEYLTLCPKDDKEWLYRIMEKQKNRLSNNESQLYKDFPHLWQELAHFMKINRKAFQELRCAFDVTGQNLVITQNKQNSPPRLQWIDNYQPLKYLGNNGNLQIHRCLAREEMAFKQAPPELKHLFNFGSWPE